MFYTKFGAAIKATFKFHILTPYTNILPQANKNVQQKKFDELIFKENLLAEYLMLPFCQNMVVKC